MRYTVTAVYETDDPNESFDVSVGRLMVAGLTDIDLVEDTSVGNSQRPPQGGRLKAAKTHAIEVADEPPPATSDERYCSDPDCPVLGDHLAHPA